MGIRRRIPGNTEHSTALVYGPDAQSRQLATAMALATLTFSPMAAGVHSAGASSRGFVGDRGYGVSRFAGRTLPYQRTAQATAPVARPLGRMLGLGAGVAGQPGYPSTGTGNVNPLVYMSAFQVGPGMAG
jgi:hypothetical protein